MLLLLEHSALDFHHLMPFHHREDGARCQLIMSGKVFQLYKFETRTAERCCSQELKAFEGRERFINGGKIVEKLNWTHIQAGSEL